MAMTPKARYAQAMERLYIACIYISGVSLVLITLAIPYGVFMRYVMNSASSWPEPFSVLLMVVFSFVGGAAVYRAGAHIAVVALLDKLNPPTRRVFNWVIDACLIFFCVFMVWKGEELVRATWYQSIAEFPGLSVGLVYMPIPICGVLLLLFIVERLWCGEPPKTSIMYRDDPEAME
jgi:TRAP-type C4-dicarboxylate transport system permease small subunit